MIHIYKSRIEIDNSSAYLKTPISIDDKFDEIWLKVDKKYAQYLCDERGDAFLIATLNYAMTNGHNINIESPISDDLLFQIENILVDALIENNPEFHRPQIIAETKSELLPNAGAVGTGISCGVDSLHALAVRRSQKERMFNITHLIYSNVGSLGEGEKSHELHKEWSKRPEKFAQEFGYEFILCDSNLMDVIKQVHYKSHTYSSMFPVFCLQKLFAKYFYASAGYRYNEFALRLTTQSPGAYEILSLPSFSTKNIVIYSDGMGKTRMEKLVEIVNYKPSYNYLHVCYHHENNCGHCEKCERTLLGLDALGVITKYNKVFDIQRYYLNKEDILIKLLLRAKEKRHDYVELLPYFKNQINLRIRLLYIMQRIKITITNMIRNNRTMYRLIHTIIRSKS